MTPAPSSPQNDLTRTLNRHAEGFAELGGSSLDLDQVLARAGEIRRGRRLRASLVMAAVVVAVAVPIGITNLVGGNNATDPAAPATHGPTLPDRPSPTTTKAKSSSNPLLSRIPLGAKPDHSYVELGVMHDVDGTTQQLPAGATDRLSGITPYLGGYLVAGAETDTVTLYDGSGKVVKSGSGPGFFVTTSDGVETAYVMDGRLYSNPGSGMASGDGAVGPISPNARLIGYLQGGVLYATGQHDADGTPQLALSGGSIGRDLDGFTSVNATDDSDDLVAGISDPAGTGRGVGRVVSLRTHQTVWSSPDWDPVSFSYDGKYVAATALDTDDTTQVAILDAATGQVVATTNLGAKGFDTTDTAFDDSDNLLVIAQQRGDGKEAILRLSRNGTLDRATAVVGGLQTDYQTPLIIPAGPQ